MKSEFGYEIDPHGAVGWLAARAYRNAHPGAVTITLETAHPAKFQDVMDAELGKDTVKIPERLAILANRPKIATSLTKDWQTFRAWLDTNID